MTAGKTIRAMTAEIREINIAKGFRPAAGGPGSNTLGDYVALLHSEISEALEAYRDYRLNDMTNGGDECPLPDEHQHKPEGVGSELADCVIRLLDTGDVFGFEVFDPDMELADVEPVTARSGIVSFGDWVALLHERVTDLWHRPDLAPAVLRTVVAMADRFDLDLVAEYERKVTFNRTRAFQHGGRTLADNHS